MSKKDYILIAKSIKARVDTYSPLNKRDFEALYTITTLVILLADDLKKENPMFDKTKFYLACGLSRLV